MSHELDDHAEKMWERARVNERLAQLPAGLRSEIQGLSAEEIARIITRAFRELR